MQAADAIVELLDEPKLEERVIGGVLHHVVESTYLITPLKTGPRTIPLLRFKERYRKKEKDNSTPSLTISTPFAIMQGFERGVPFTLMTEEIQLAVQPAVSEGIPMGRRQKHLPWKSSGQAIKPCA